MYVNGYIILQVFVPFILYSFEELVVFGVHLNITTSIKLFVWIFGLTTVFYFHKRHSIFGHQISAYTIIAFFNMFALK